MFNECLEEVWVAFEGDEQYGPSKAVGKLGEPPVKASALAAGAAAQQTTSAGVVVNQEEEGFTTQANEGWYPFIR